jgi:hypothetical protein
VPKDPLAPSFDPARSVTFDLEHGHVELADGEAQVLVPADALSALLAGESSARGLGRAIGVAAMERVGMRVAGAREGGTQPGLVRDQIRTASLETIVEMLGGELATVGVGNLRVERWGKALLFVLDPYVLDERADELLCGVFEGALAGVTDRECAALVVDRSGQQVRVLVANDVAILRARKLRDGGAFFTAIASKLQDDRENA